MIYWTKVSTFKTSSLFHNRKSTDFQPNPVKIVSFLYRIFMLKSSSGITRTLHRGEISYPRGESQISKSRLHPQTLSQTGLISCAQEHRVVYLPSPALLVLLNVLSESTSYDRAEPNDLRRSHFILDRSDTWKLLQCLLVRIWKHSRLLCYQFTPSRLSAGLPQA